MNALDFVLWVALPYAGIAVFIVGHLWRYRYDKFGWTSRSSEVYESRLLRLGSPMFHFGALLVLGGHLVGLLVPAEWLYAIGIDEHMYHWGATVLGTAAAAMLVFGLAVLIYRRRTVGTVFLATTVMDKVMYVFLAGTILLGTAATAVHQIAGGGYNYRETVSPWVRGIILLQPDPTLMLDVPLLFQLHAVCATLLFILWPFTRLVHVFSAPIGYLFRPYIVYRSRDEHRGSRSIRRGWEGSRLPEKTPQQKRF